MTFVLLIVQNLSFDEVKTIDAIRNGEHMDVQKELKKLHGTDKAFIDSVCNTMNKEIRLYATTASDSLLQRTEATELCSFSLIALALEFEKHLPTLMTVVCRLIDHEEHRAIAATIVSKILAVYNQRLSSYRYVNGMILSTGGAKETCINRLHRTGDCVTPQALRKKVTDMSHLSSHLTKDWDLPRTDSSIVYDNVNPYVKPRHQTSSKGNKLYSMTHSLMVRDRVPTSHLSDQASISLEDLDASVVLPTDDDKLMIEDSFARILCNIWARHVPSLEWMKQSVPKHQYSRFTKLKTEFVSKFHLLSLALTIMDDVLNFSHDAWLYNISTTAML